MGNDVEDKGDYAELERRVMARQDAAIVGLADSLVHIDEVNFASQRVSVDAADALAADAMYEEAKKRMAARGVSYTEHRLGGRAQFVAAAIGAVALGSQAHSGYDYPVGRVEVPRGSRPGAKDRRKARKAQKKAKRRNRS